MRVCLGAFHSAARNEAVFNLAPVLTQEQRRDWIQGAGLHPQKPILGDGQD